MKSITYKWIILLMMMILAVGLSRASDYYFSSVSGNDSQKGISQSEAWKTFSPLSNIQLKPGDRILLEANSQFTGTLTLEIQGTKDKAIYVGKYGEGKLPRIDGNGNEAAIFLKNPSNILIENIEIVNWKGKYAINFIAENAGEMRNVIFQDLDIHEVGYETTLITEPSKSIGGICGRVLKGDKASWWDGLIMRRLYIHNVGSCGITFGNNVNLYELTKDDPYYKPHLNVLIEDCRLDSIVRDGIWIRQCDGALIQNCKVSRTGMNAISNGIWFWDCLNSVMQYNEGWECLSPRGNDGAPFSIDNHCWNCIIQYNYSHDNEGPGYMLFGRMGDNGGNIIRNNISYNDNVTRTYKHGTASIAVVSEVKNGLIENNTIVAGQDTYSLLGHRNWEGYPHSVTYRKNLFIGNSRPGISEPGEVFRAGTFEKNTFINIPDIPEELKNRSDFREYLKCP